MTGRLSLATLNAMRGRTRLPRFDPSQLATGIVHLGCGAFHRAHQAMHTQAAIEASGGDWGVVAVSLRGDDVPSRLAPQDGLFAVLERGADGPVLSVNATLRATIGPAGLAEAVAAIARPATRIVTLTVTEKGYCRDPAQGDLDETHPDIRADLDGHSPPRSAPGLIVAGLAARRAAGAGGLALLSCDNLPDNGAATCRVVRQFAALRDPGLAAWIDAEIDCPSAMVDRIVPAVTDADRDTVASLLGLRDEACVVTEPFSQWVIEDRFRAGRPDWESGGATLVRDVAPFEHMKLRLLNGSHSTIAYLGYLAGHAYVAEAIAAPGFATLVGRLWDEAAPTLTLPAGTDLAGYRAQLLARFSNPHLAHRTWQIAMDGTQKLPQRLLATIADNLAAGRSIDVATLGVAAWMRYVRGTDERGDAIEIRDPLAQELARHADFAPVERVERLLGLSQVFGGALPRAAPFRRLLVHWLERLEREGAAAVVRGAAMA
jgi:fructuronate reductase